MHPRSLPGRTKSILHAIPPAAIPVFESSAQRIGTLDGLEELRQDEQQTDQRELQQRHKQIN